MVLKNLGRFIQEKQFDLISKLKNWAKKYLVTKRGLKKITMLKIGTSRDSPNKIKVK